MSKPVDVILPPLPEPDRGSIQAGREEISLGHSDEALEMFAREAVVLNYKPVSVEPVAWLCTYGGQDGQPLPPVAITDKSTVRHCPPDFGAPVPLYAHSPVTQSEPVAFKDTMHTTHPDGRKEHEPRLLGYEGWESLPDGTELYAHPPVQPVTDQRAAASLTLADEPLPTKAVAVGGPPATEPAPGYCPQCKQYTIAEPLHASPPATEQDVAEHMRLYQAGCEASANYAIARERGEPGPVIEVDDSHAAVLASARKLAGLK